MAQKTILLVEDEAVIAMNELSALRAEGYSAIHASSGLQAVEVVRSSPVPIDLILMDIDLGPGMDGTEAAREILKEHSIPVVFLSSHTEKQVVEKTKAITSYGYIYKNAGDVVLLASIDMAFKLYEAHRKIEESEKRYSDLFNNMLVGVLQTTPEGRFTYVNPSVARALGYESPDEMLDEVKDVGLQLYANPDDRDALKKALAERGHVDNVQFEYFDRSGKSLWALLNASATFSAPGVIQYITCTILDITRQKRIKAELEASEARYRALAQASFEAIILSENGVCLDVNDNALALTGYSRDELIGMKLVQLIAPELREDVARNISLGLEQQYKAVGMRRDGSVYPVEIHAKMFNSNGRLVRATAFRDITEREAHLGKIQKQTEELAVANEELESTNEELRNIIEEMESTNEELTRSQEDLMEHERALMASEEKYQRLYGQAIEGMFQMTPGGMFQKANPALARFLGFPTVAGMIAAGEEDLNSLFAHPREANRLRKLVLAFGRIENAEVEVRTASGGKAWGLVNAIAERNEKGMVASIHGSCIDITRLKLAEWALRESEEKYRILIEEAADPIFSLSPEGRYLFANRAFAEGVGFPVEEILGRTLYDIFPAEEAEPRMEMLKQSIQTASETQTENRVPRRDGDQYYITTYKPVMDDAGRVLSVLCSSKNITERRKATMELEKALEEKHLLYHELQHRVKNNLSIVISLLSLGMNQISDETSRKIIRDSQSRIRTMAAFYEELCRSDTPGSVELHRYIRHLAAAVVDTLSAGGMKVELETRLAEVSLDTRRSVPLGLIVNELITNSIKHAHPGGRGCRIGIELENRDGLISLAVSDDGKGFPEGFSPDAHMNSMGVHLITALAGQIQAGVKFVNDNGARVTVEFPLQA